MSDQLVTEEFSAGYDIVHGVDIHSYDGEEALMDCEMFEALEKQFSFPVVGRIGNLHYYFKPQKAIPPLSVAVPAHNHDNPEQLLIQS